MHWILLAVLAVILVTTASRYPRLAFSMLALLAVIAAALYYLVDEDGQGQFASLDPVVIEIRNIEMTPAYAGSFKAAGEIVNQSNDHDIYTLSIRFSVNDCPPGAGSDTSQCDVISQVVEPIKMHIPIDGSARFEQTVSPRRIKVKGERQWTFKVIDVTGRVPLRAIYE